MCASLRVAPRGDCRRRRLGTLRGPRQPESLPGPWRRPAFAEKRGPLLSGGPHLQCASRLASRDRSAGSPHAARKPHLTPRPPASGEGWGEGGRVPAKVLFLMTLHAEFDRPDCHSRPGPSPRDLAPCRAAAPAFCASAGARPGVGVGLPAPAAPRSRCTRGAGDGRPGRDRAHAARAAAARNRHPPTFYLPPEDVQMALL